MAHDVFISYASKDKVVADAVCATLEGQKIRCWIAPRDVLAGVPYGESLIKALNSCRIMILVFSSSSNSSPQVLREMERAVSKGIPIIPFRIEDVPPSEAMEYFISAPHWLDALTPPLEKHLQSLAETVKVLLSRPKPGDTAKPGHEGSLISADKMLEAKEGEGNKKASPRKSVWKSPLALSAMFIAGLGIALLLYHQFISNRSSQRSEQAGKASRTNAGDALLSSSNPSAPAATELTAPTVEQETTADASIPAIKEADVPELKAVLTLKGHSRHAMSVAYSPDGKILATGGDDTPEESPLKVQQELLDSISSGAKNVGAVRLWDSQTGQASWTLWSSPGAVTTVAFSADGKTVAAASGDATVRSWAVATGGAQRTFAGPEGAAVRSIAFSSDGRWLACGLANKTVLVWNVRTGELKRTLAGHKDEITAVAFSRDGAILASASRDRTVILWDVQTGDSRQTLAEHRNSVGAVAFSPDDRSIATGSADMKVMTWDAKSGKQRLTLAGHRDEVTSVSFSADGKSLASASDDGRVFIWDARTGELKRRLLEHGSKIACVAFSPVGSTLATASWDKTVKLWRIE